jgi:catechol 2,3-dioxygenase-like lactoylglutathione lyase family enzyme
MGAHVRIIHEWSGGGTLPRKELHEAARELTVGQAGLIAVGGPTTGKGVGKTLAGAANFVKRGVEATIGEITSELQEAIKEADMVDMHLEVDIIPVSDVDRAKQFYQRLGWRLDQDAAPLEGLRIVQFTPPGSAASVTFGTGLTTAAPGSAEGGLTVSDIVAAHDELAGRGIDASDIWHGPPFPVEARQPGPDPERTSYGSFCSFTDPDGNTWLVQEVTTRLPGRV